MLVGSGEPRFVVGMTVKPVLNGVPTDELETDEFETDEPAIVEVEVGGAGEAGKKVVGIAVGSRMAVARELSESKPSCATARNVLPFVFFNHLARLVREGANKLTRFDVLKVKRES